jgi:hypothetical protein
MIASVAARNALAFEPIWKIVRVSTGIPSSPKRILARERQSEALQMRKEGQTFAEISKHFSVTAKTAYAWAPHLPTFA